MPRLTAAQLLRALERDGWFVGAEDGELSPNLAPSDEGEAGRTTIAMHPGETIKIKTLAQIMKDTQLTVEAAG